MSQRGSNYVQVLEGVPSTGQSALEEFTSHDNFFHLMNLPSLTIQSVEHNLLVLVYLCGIRNT